jgi:formylmethanofuran dehydrogenase subunit C
MMGGVIEIAGAAGDRVGGPLAGEMAGMRGGIVIVRKDAGDRVGDRMRRGTIVVEGRAGSHAGCRMIAGTLLVRRRAGAFPGYLMRRGTIVLGGGADKLSPSFVDCGAHDLVAMKLMAGFLAGRGVGVVSALRRPLRRFAGDMAVMGKGEIFLVDG